MASRRVKWLLLGVACVCLLVGHELGHVHADGAPEDVLWYAGTAVGEKNQPLIGNHNVWLRVFSQQAGAEPALCKVGPVELPFENGSFRINAAECLRELSGRKEVFVELSIGDESKPLPRARIGAVPFALEANRAARLGPARDEKNEITVDRDGRVGIGVPAPSERLHVDGVVVATPNSRSVTIREEREQTKQVFEDVPGVVVQLTTHGSPVLLTANANFNGLDASNDFNKYARLWGWLTIRRDDKNLGGATGLQLVETQYHEGNQPATIVFIDYPEPGPHTYALQFKLEAGAKMMLGQSGQATQLSATELN